MRVENGKPATLVQLQGSRVGKNLKQNVLEAGRHDHRSVVTEKAMKIGCTSSWCSWCHDALAAGSASDRARPGRERAALPRVSFGTKRTRGPPDPQLHLRFGNYENNDIRCPTRTSSSNSPRS
jgi:hypothetical protein